MKVGDKVRNFTLKNTEKKEVSLSNVAESGKKTLILFFPMAFSSVCTEELCKIRDNFKFYNALKSNVLGISVDSYYSLRAFKKTNNLPFPLLSDFNKEVSRSFNVLNEDFNGMIGVSKRAAFVLNSQMEVEYAEVLDNAGDLPDFKAIQKVLEG